MGAAWGRFERRGVLVAMAWLVGCAGTAGAGPRCSTPAAAVLRARGIAVATTEFPHAAVTAQEGLGGDLCFARALDLAVGGFVGDDRDLESPLALAATAVPGRALCSGGEPGDRLRCYLQQPGSELGLLAGADLEPGAEGGEVIADRWIFYLVVPSLSDHVYWATVDRRAVGGRREIWVYGFN